MNKRIRALIADVADLPHAEVAALPDDTALFGPEIALDSMRGAALLAAIEEELGVDVAAEDLNLDALESIGTLCAFLGSARPTAPRRGAPAS